MIRATDVRAQQSWKGDIADTVVLDFDDRHRRRMTMTATRGLQFLLDLPNAIALRGGDALVLEDGRLVEVVAAPEPLLEARADDPKQMVRIAWHLGNRHLPMQIVGRGLRIRRDHVIEEMLRGFGAKLIEIEAPFDPEGGAYAQAEPVAHGHDHHDHDRHGHERGHAHDHASDHGHDHHGHDHHAHHHGHDDCCDDPSHDHHHGHSHDHSSHKKGGR